MIQRIQSFLLVLAVVGVALCYMFPVAVINTDTLQAQLNLLPHSTVPNTEVMVINQTNWVLSVLNLVVGVIALVSIFLYKNRVRQMRVVTVGALVSVIQLGLIFLWAAEAFAKHLPADVQVSYSVGSYIPMVTTVLLFVAQRCIRSDEMKVRASDRIR